MPTTATGMVAAIAIDVGDPMFESQTKTKLGSNNMWPAAPQARQAPRAPTVNKYVGDFIKTGSGQLPPQNPLVAEVMLQKIQDSEKEAQSHCRRHQAGTRTRQESQDLPQPQAARLPLPLE